MAFSGDSGDKCYNYGYLIRIRPSGVGRVDERALQERLGLAIRHRRIAHGWSRQQLADHANVSLGAVRHLETADGATVRTLVRVVAALGETDWLDALKPPSPGLSPLAVAKQALREQAERDRAARARVRKARAKGNAAG